LYEYVNGNPTIHSDPDGLGILDWLTVPGPYGSPNPSEWGSWNDIRRPVQEYGSATERAIQDSGVAIASVAMVVAVSVGIYEVVALSGDSIVVSYKGGEVVLSRGPKYALDKCKTFFRLNPFGDSSSANPLGRKPHYHSRPINRPAAPGEGIGRHRPWE